MAAALEAAKEQLLCPLCKSNFRDPKTILCLHSFCKSCIDEHIRRTITSSSKPNSFDCPICQKPTAINGFVGLKPEDWSDQLPTNEALLNILKALNKIDIAPESQCPRHKEKEVEFFCDEHEIFACSLCTSQSHRSCRSVSTLSDAVTKRRNNSGTLLSDLSTQITETEKILNNRQDQLEMLESVEADIKEEMSQIKNQLNEFLSQMESKILDSMAELKHKESGLIQLEINKCHDIIKQANESLNKMNELIIDQSDIRVVDNYNTQLKSYEDRQDMLSGMLETLTEVKIKYIANREIEKTLSEADNIGSLSIERVRSKLAKPVSEIPELSKPSSNDLDAILEDEGELEEGGIQLTSRSNKVEASISDAKSVSEVSVGTESEDENDVKVPKLNLEKVIHDSKKSESKKDTPQAMIKARFMTEFNVASEKQTECTIEGATFLPTGHIVVTDSQNNCLKLFDSTFKFMAMTRFTVPPGDITAIAEREVVVCLPDVLKLKHEKIDLNYKKITAGEILNINDRCLSVSYSNRKLASCSKSTVYIYSRQGSAWVLESSVNLHVNNLKFIALDMLAERFVVTRDGYPNRSIICMTTSGVKAWAFTHQEIRLPRGIAFCGNKLLVAASDQKTIFQLNGKDGNFDGTVVPEGGLQWPWKLCVNPKGDKMLISQSHFKMAGQDKNRLLIFRLNKVQMAS